MKVRIMLCQGAISFEYFSGQPYMNFATASCRAVKAGKNVIMLCAFGVVYEECRVDFESTITSIGANTAWLRGRSGHTNVRNSCANIPFSDASTVLLQRLANSGL